MSINQHENQDSIESWYKALGRTQPSPFLYTRVIERLEGKKDRSAKNIFFLSVSFLILFSFLNAWLILGLIEGTEVIENEIELVARMYHDMLM